MEKTRIVAGLLTGVIGLAVTAADPGEAALTAAAVVEAAVPVAESAPAVLTPPNAGYQTFIADPMKYYQDWQAFMAEAGGAEMAVPELPKSGWIYTVQSSFLFNLAGLGRLMFGAGDGTLMTAQEYLAVNGKSGAAAVWPADLDSQPMVNVKKSGTPVLCGADFPAYGHPALLANRSGSAYSILFLGVEKIGVRHGIEVGFTSEPSSVMNGIQLGILRNRGFSVNGFQIGVLNSVAMPGVGIGFQIGLLNDNGRFTLPLLNIVY